MYCTALVMVRGTALLMCSNIIDDVIYIVTSVVLNVLVQEHWGVEGVSPSRMSVSEKTPTTHCVVSGGLGGRGPQ